ncbi:MAG: lactate racemase domain-containing protein [Anaerolineales bacterium]
MNDGIGFIGGEFSDGVPSEQEILSLLVEAVSRWDLTDKRVLIIIPDGTRTAPVPTFFKLIYQVLRDKVASLDYLIALGTHPPMSELAIERLIGTPPSKLSKLYPGVKVFQHRWDLDETFTSVGVITRTQVSDLTQGRLASDVTVSVNKILFDYDQLILCGPVFPHEAAGFSGGNKYLFPGVSGPDVIDLIHWLGALETNLEVVGKKVTATRAVIDHAASYIDIPKLAVCMVTQGSGLAGLFIGEPVPAWSKAADLSAQLHIRYFDKPFLRVLSVIPQMYADLWTGAKGVLKVEPVVADGGEVVIYAPHIREIANAHSDVIERIGYHVRDYFVRQWEEYKNVPGRLLSHSTLVKGSGTYKNGIESPRIRVTLATHIPRSRCLQLNISYLDPASIDIREWSHREDEGILVVPEAGEILYRLK